MYCRKCGKAVGDKISSALIVVIYYKEKVNKLERACRSIK